MFARFSLPAKPRKQAFTLIEMLVVIAIIGILASMLMPSLTKALDSARGVQCASNLKQIYLLQNAYAHDYEWYMPGKLPTGYGPNFGMNNWDLKLSKYFGKADPTSWGDAIALWQDPLYWCPSKTEKKSDTRCFAPSSFSGITYWSQTKLSPSTLSAGTANDPGGIYMVKPQARTISQGPSKIVFYAELGHWPSLPNYYTHISINTAGQFDGSDGATTPDFRHNETKNVLMLDGHIRTARLAEVQWWLYFTD